MTTGPKPFDMTTQRYGRLSAIEYVSHGNWKFTCDCGSEKVAWGTDVRRGKIRSCGCLSAERNRTGDNRRTHGLSGTPEYVSWLSMMTRCYNPNSISFYNYGARGIDVCDEWQADFENFLVDMGHRPPGTSLDRIDPNGNYEPSNCRWADAIVQGSNRRDNQLVTANGVTQCMEAWSRELGCSSKTLAYRRKRGWDDDKIVNTPVRAYRSW
jgi:hypothetical protein